MFEILQRGGLFMLPIIACSIVGVAIALERGLYFARIPYRAKALVEELQRLLRAGDLSGARQRCADTPGPISRVLGELCAAWSKSKPRREEIASVAGSRELRKMETRLRGLAVIGQTAPLLGLLGTVVGLVSAFMTISAHEGRVNPSMLAGGIWQALLTTVAGLVVAIPAILTYEWFESRVDKMEFALREATTTLLDEEPGGEG